MIDKLMRAVQTLMITSVTHHQQRFSMRNTEIKGRNNAAPITQGVIGAARRLLGRNPETGVTMHRELVCECVLFVSLLNNPRYIFIVRRLSIVSKSDSNYLYRIWAELYFSNLNYLIKLDTRTKLDTWPIRPYSTHAGADSQVNYIYSLSTSCSRRTFWSSQIMAITGSARSKNIWEFYHFCLACAVCA
jgi:hypothetical protein